VMGFIFSKLMEFFWSRELEVVLVGLENSGKTTFCNYISHGKPLEHQEPVAPTVGLNVKIMKKGGVTVKVWDIGGQVKFRSEWSRYARGCNVLVFLIDTQRPSDLPIAKKELHQLLEDKELSSLPLLILANKIDLGPKMSEQELIEGLNLDYISENSWLLIPCSAKTGQSIDKAMEFLIKQSKT
jgi:ADP-ribosylation factor-like protein 8